MKDREMVVLINFLKSGLSTRELDRLLGLQSHLTKGWESWRILKKYMLKNDDKGKLFIYSERQSREIIKKLMNSPTPDFINNFIEANQPKNIEKYKDTFVIAKSERAFSNILSGETRNIIQGFFSPLKKIIGKCQFKNCTSKEQLDTVHYLIDRPKIFKNSAKTFRTEIGNGYFKYDVYKIMENFLQSHAKKRSVCFLCKKHHKEFHDAEKNNGFMKQFKKNIVFD